MKNLIRMVDFVLEQEKDFGKGIVGFKEFTNNVCNYAKFLKQPLELWMFVPCKLIDGVWVVLHEPTKSIRISGGRNLANEKRLDEYQQAKERCLFDGFEAKEFKGTGNFSVVDKSGLLNIMWKFKTEKNWRPSIGISTTEDLVRYNLELTETAQKQIFG